MASRGSADKLDDEEQQSVSLLQSNAEAVTRDFQLKLTILDLIEEGHKAAAVAIGASIVIGIILGFTLQVDQNIPGESWQQNSCVPALQQSLLSLWLALPTPMHPDAEMQIHAL